MALVPWTYSNPFVDRRSMQKQQFTFLGQLIEIIQDTQAEIDVSKNTGLKLWDGAFLLAKFIENNKDFTDDFWKGKSCVELGAGCGLAGTVAWLKGANTVLTDLPNTIGHTQKCIEINTSNVTGTRPESELKSAVLEWGSHTMTIKYPVDVIVGSDIIYHPDAIEDLIKTLDLLSTDSTTILISYKPRGLGEDIFFVKLKESNFSFSIIPQECYPVDFLQSDYVIYNIKKSSQLIS